MIDANGKLFGKISVVDLFAALAVIIAVAGIYVRFFGGPSKTVVENSTFYYSFKVTNIRESNAKGLERSVGTRFYLNEKITSEMGVLKDVSVSPGITYLEDINGEIVRRDNPERFDALLTFEISGRVNDNGYFTPSLEDISAGIKYNIKGKYSSVAGVVERVWQQAN